MELLLDDFPFSIIYGEILSDWWFSGEYAPPAGTFESMMWFAFPRWDYMGYVSLDPIAHSSIFISGIGAHLWPSIFCFEKLPRPRSQDAFGVDKKIQGFGF